MLVYYFMSEMGNIIPKVVVHPNISIQSFKFNQTGLVSIDIHCLFCPCTRSQLVPTFPRFTNITKMSHYKEKVITIRNDLKMNKDYWIFIFRWTVLIGLVPIDIHSLFVHAVEVICYQHYQDLARCVPQKKVSHYD